MLLVQGRGEIAIMLQLLHYCYIRVLWIQGLTAVLLVQGRWEFAVISEITAALIHHNAMDRRNANSVVITG